MLEDNQVEIVIRKIVTLSDAKRIRIQSIAKGYDCSIYQIGYAGRNPNKEI